MQLKLFSFTTSYWSWSWKIDTEKVHHSVSTWLNANPGITVREIQHDTMTSFWYPPQLLISIYYDGAQ